MKKKIQMKINGWRERPEHERLRIATLLTWGGGATMIIIWLVLLLPLQIRLTGDDTAEPRVQGTIAPSVSPTPTPSPDLFL